MLSVKVIASGAVKMTFSVFADAEVTSRANRQLRLPRSFMMVVVGMPCSKGVAVKLRAGVCQ